MCCYSVPLQCCVDDFRCSVCIELVIKEACGGRSWGTKTERNVLSSSDNAEQFLAFVVQSGFFN